MVNNLFISNSSIKSTLIPLFILVLGLSLYCVPSFAMDMDHSKHKMGEKAAKKDEAWKKQNQSAWPKTNGVDAWDHEEFSADGLQDELNTEIGVVVHHQHKSGNWMLGYKYMNMSMDGLIRGTQEKKGNEAVSTEQIARAQMNSNPRVPVAGFDYLMAPVDMTMKMHMLMGMYGWSDNTSIMFMTNYLENNMNMVMHMGNANAIVRSNYSDMSTSGISDTTVTAMIRASEAWTVSFSVSLPTGSIDEQVTMNGNSIQAPYNMQLGSGTIDFLQSVTYKGGDSSFNWGLQESFTYRTGANANGYVLGNKFEFNTWVRKTFSNRFSISTRFNIYDLESLEGRDVKIMNASMSPTFDPANSGRHQSNVSLGFSKRFDGGNRLGFEYSKPISQLVNGVQMKNQYTYTLSWSYMM